VEDIEKKIIEILLVNFDKNEVIEETILKTKEEYICNLEIRELYKLLIKMYKKGRPIEDLFNAKTKFEKLLWEALDSKLTINSNAREKYFKKLKENYDKRNLEFLLRKSLSDLHTEDTEDILNRMQNQIIKFSIEQESNKENIVDSKESMEKFYSKYDNEDRLKPLKTNITFLDKYVKFLKGELYTIAARPGSGKTALSLALLKNFCENGNNGLFFSMEMTEESLTNRLVSSISGVHIETIMNGSFKETNMESDLVAGAVAKLGTYNYSIVDKSGLTIEQIVGIARKVNRIKKLDFIILDYVGQIKPSSHSDDLRITIGNAIRNFKQMAKDFNIPFITLAQMNRGVDARAEKKPVLSDLKESGTIEEESGAVIMLSNPNTVATTEAQDQKRANYLDVFIRKNRHGQLGEFKIGFEGHTQYIGDV
jgi:replicative DNA helicase